MIREIIQETIELNEKITSSEDKMITYLFRRIGNGDMSVKKDSSGIKITMKSIFPAGTKTDLDRLVKSFPKEFPGFILKRYDDLVVLIVKKVGEGIKSVKSYTYDNDSAVHNEFKSYKEILKAVKTGKSVYWGNENYELSLDNDGKIGVTSLSNNSYILLGDTKYDIERCFIKK